MTSPLCKNALILNFSGFANSGNDYLFLSNADERLTWTDGASKPDPVKAETVQPKAEEPAKPEVSVDDYATSENLESATFKTPRGRLGAMAYRALKVIGIDIGREKTSVYTRGKGQQPPKFVR